jgi:hypothetical protein
MERSTVKKLHAEINEALKKVAEANGFVFQTGNLRYSDLDVTGRVKFIVASKAGEYQASNKITSHYSGLLAGDEVRLAGHPETYKIVEFTKRGSAIIIPTRDFNSPLSKKYRAKTLFLTKVGAEDTKVVVQTVGIKKAPRTEAEIMNQLTDVFGALSPENLTCDGELPIREVNARRARLNRELQDLERELGRKVSEEQVWAWAEKNQPAFK